MSFTEMIAVYSKNRTKDINAFCGPTVELQIVKADCTYSVVRWKSTDDLEERITSIFRVK
jgi:hypothetical protein